VTAPGADVEASDIHGHCIPQAFLDEVVRTRAFGVETEHVDGKYVLTFPGSKALRPISGAMLDTTDRSAWLTGQGLGHQVVAPWLDVHGQDLPAADGAQWVRLLNDALAESVADPTLRLSAHATLHLADAEAAAAELRRCVEDLHMRSAMIPTNLASGRLSDPGFDALWAVAEQLEVPVVLHPPAEAPSNDLVAHYPLLGGLFGRQIDSTLVAAELILSGVLDRFPALRLVLVHGGGFLPYQSARFERDAKAGADAATLPSDAVRALYYDTVLMSPAALRFLYDSVGSAQVMIGSDYGAGPRDRSGVQVTAAAQSATTDEAVNRAVLHDNARTLFRLS
jgi:aminocarboxymuconate-semialdehyde decarboxylase